MAEESQVKADGSKKDLSKAKIIDSATGKKPGKRDYTGDAVTPKVKVQVKVGRTWTDVPETDYNLEYIGNVCKGKGTIVVSGKGAAASGSSSTTFKIVSKSLSVFQLLGF